MTELEKALKSIADSNPYASFLSESTLSTVENYINTGSYVLNAICSGKIKDGGIPENRVTMLYGESGTGKSLFIQKILAFAQKQGKIPVIFDTENAIDKESALRLGLDVSKLILVPVFNVEQCRNELHKFLTGVKERGSEGQYVVAIDSLGNLQSAQEASRIEKDSSSADMGSRARAIKSLMQTATQLSAITHTTIIISNHIYDNPSELHPSMLKNQSGGKSVVYLPSLSVQLSKKPMKEGENKADTSSTAALQRNYNGLLIRALTSKNRFIKQYLQGEIYLSFSSGVDKYYGLLELAQGLDIIQQNGATYTFQGEKIGYAKNFSRDKDFWENKVIPLLQEKIDKEWAYSGVDDELDVVVSNSVEEEEEIPVEG